MIRYLHGSLLGVLLTLVGCATTPYGNFVESDLAYNDEMAAFTVAQLVVLYAPAKTRIDIGQSIAKDDAFGQALVRRLHQQGYAVAHPAQLSDPLGPVEELPPTNVSLRYIVDQVNSIHYRVTVYVGGQTLSRMFQAHNGTFGAVGLWARRE